MIAMGLANIPVPGPARGTTVGAGGVTPADRLIIYSDARGGYIELPLSLLSSAQTFQPLYDFSLSVDSQYL